MVFADLFIDVLEISAVTSLVIAGLKLLSPLLNRNYAAKWKYWIWMILAIRLIIPFNFTIPHAPIQLYMPEKTVVVSEIQITNPQIVKDEPLDGIYSPIHHQAATPFEHTISFDKILILVWLSGVMLFLLYQFTGYYFFRKQSVRWSCPISNRRIKDILKQLSKEMNIKTEIGMLTSGKIFSPTMIGLQKPLLLLPHEDYTDTELAFILRHELIHFKRHDIAYKLLLLIANAVHWFNPFVWLMVREAGSEIEIYCDETVVSGKNIGYRKQYCETIYSAMHEHAKSIAFSTNFSGGKNSMKQRFTNILSMGKKRNGIFALCAAFLLVSVSGMLIAFKNVDDNSLLNPGTIYSYTSSGEQVISYNAGNSYSLDSEGRVTISYNNGETKAETLLTLYPSGNNYESGMSVDQTGFYISKDKTAIAYGGFNEESVQVLVSENMGKSWKTYTVTKKMGGSTKYIGFTTKNEGWLVLSNFRGMGSEENYIYKTADGGKTWTEVVGNANTVYPRVLTGAAFANDNIGFLGFRYDTADFQPAICQTRDGGLTWEKLHITLPEKYGEYSKTPLSPAFDKENGLFPILLSKNGASNIVGTVYLKSNDYGKTWVYDKTTDAMTDTNTNNALLIEQEAINKVIKDNPRFPDKIESKNYTENLGGKEAKLCTVTYDTKIEPNGEYAFYVTLTQTWDTKIKGETPVVYTKYNVTKDNVVVIDRKSDFAYLNFMK